ncbi:putative RNA-binding protein containing Zn ribbon [Cylindrospermum stagnale PCC 7417]|uniref:Putative RNA-binding protein containing Zn ribbon n=1 Tax=Cylindrospermum stagnale PCC 7417 TaxID=56107 RepID=K9X4D3_9NOST|nr:DciA family protein [Cylindrospermum stagnale]AFZ26959.1 putative RNA-binding protein containing Zn ribbon [Cylindrospermum stagnale PCC 7417]
MSFKSVNDILGGLEQQAKWQEPPLQSLLKCWAEIVGAVVAAHARPVSIQRDVLSVATSSAAWSQNLTFGRQSLLLKLNQKLPTPLVDIRFSTANWRLPPETQKLEQTILPREHPSYLGDQSSSIPDVIPTLKNVNAAFEDWARAMQRRSHNLPLCPGCQCPTPPGELQRWRVCAPCAAKQLANNS